MLKKKEKKKKRKEKKRKMIEFRDSLERVVDLLLMLYF